MSESEDQPKDDLEEAQEIRDSLQEESKNTSLSENTVPSTDHTIGKDEAIPQGMQDLDSKNIKYNEDEEDTNLDNSASPTADEKQGQPVIVSSQKSLLPQSENATVQNEPTEDYQLKKGVLKVEMHSLPQEEGKSLDNTASKTYAVSTEQTEQIDTHLVVDTAERAFHSNANIPDKAVANVSDTYDVISRNELQNFDDWENVQKSCLSEIPPIDPGALHDLERRARDVAGNLDHLLGTLATTLKSMSVIAMRSVDTYGSCVEHVGETVDASVKSVYTLVAKCEQLDASMTPLYRMAAQIKDIKRTLDIFESVCK